MARLTRVVEPDVPHSGMQRNVDTAAGGPYFYDDDPWPARRAATTAW